MIGLVIGLGVLIVLGVAGLGITLVRRLGAPTAPAAAATLQEPPGTHIATMASAQDRIALLLQGGGPDRVLLLDPRTGQITGRIALAP